MTCPRPRRVPSSSPGSPDFVTASSRPGSTPRCSSPSADVYHLAGTAQNAHLVVPVDGEPLLLVRRDLERARAESALEAIEPLASLRGLEPALAGLGLGPGSSIGLELDVLPAATYLRYAALLPDRRLGDAMPAVWAARAPQERVGARARARGLRAGHRCDAGAAAARAGGEGRGGPALRARGRDARARARGHRPLPRPEQRVLLRAGARRARRLPCPGRPTRPSQGPDLSPSQGRGPSRRPLAAGDAIVVDVTGLAGRLRLRPDAHGLPGRARSPARRRRTRPAARSCTPARSCSCRARRRRRSTSAGSRSRPRPGSGDALHGVRAGPRALRGPRDRPRAERGARARARRRRRRSSRAR